MPVKKGTRKAPDTLVSGATAVLITGTAVSPSSDQRLVVLPLSCSFGLLLTLYAGLLVMLAFSGFGQDTGTSSHALESTQRALQRFVFPDTYFRHRVFPPLAIAGTVWPM